MARLSRLLVAGDLATGNTISLEPDRAHYVRNVLRLREGDSLILFNGDGSEYTGVISSISKRDVALLIETSTHANRESPLEIHLGLGIARRESMDVSIQKAVELGVHTITPVITEYTSVARKAIHTRASHWEQVIGSACEQCERNHIPELNPAMPFESWLRDVDARLRLMPHPGATALLPERDPAPGSIAIITGPEGGFSGGEVEQASRSGFLPMQLGPRILRAETAVVAMLTLAQFRWGDFQD